MICCSSMIIGKGKTTLKPRNSISNRLIDYDQFQKTVNSSAQERETKRLTEEEFLTMISEKDVILLDARSESRFKLRHIKGAINLPFTEFTKESLAEIVPSFETKILIYCNNNFEGSPQAFAAKSPAASLNLSTFVSLKVYGYKNIYELGPLLDVEKTKLPFEGSEVQ
nr:rhodanese-like domain-containing protein [Leptospira ainlahdjerensis]